MVAAGLDLSREGGCQGLGLSWFSDVPGQWAQDLVLVLHTWRQGSAPEGLRPRSPYICTLGF